MTSRNSASGGPRVTIWAQKSLMSTMRPIAAQPKRIRTSDVYYTRSPKVLVKPYRKRFGAEHSDKPLPVFARTPGWRPYRSFGMAARGRTAARPYLAVAYLCALACWAAVTRAATLDPAAAESHFNLVGRPPLLLGHTSYILGNDNSNLCYSTTRMAWPPHVGPAALRMRAAAHAHLRA
jgi:hypothetical protein